MAFRLLDDIGPSLEHEHAADSFGAIEKIPDISPTEINTVQHGRELLDKSNSHEHLL